MNSLTSPSYLLWTGLVVSLWCALPHVCADPIITMQPTNQTVLAGASVSFTVSASGTAPLNYQWHFNSANITNATGATLTVNSVTTNHAGGYSVVVTNSVGSVTSEVAVLTVHTRTLANPDTFSIAVGSNVFASISNLMGNDLPGSANPTGSFVRLVSLSSTSAMSGTLSLINTQIWLARYKDPGNSNAGSHALALDPLGNVYVAGHSTATNGTMDYATVAYSPTGVPLWTNRYNGPGNSDDFAHDIAVSRLGAVFVTGSSIGTNGRRNYSTAAYSTAGVPLWTNRYDGPGIFDDEAYAIAVDDSGKVIVTGGSYGSSSTDYATVAYLHDGVALWTNRYRYPGTGFDAAESVAVDNKGNVFVTGGSTAAYREFATIAYSGAGVALWTNRYQALGSSWASASEIVADGNGRVVVAGFSSGTPTGDDYAIITYSGMGTPLWTNRYSGPGNGDDYATAIAVDGTGKLFVTGLSSATNGASDYATVAYSTSGVPLWTNRYNGPGNSFDDPYGIAVDGNGNVFITGYSMGTNGIAAYATIAYSPSGAQLWLHRYPETENIDAGASAIAVDNKGTVVVTGSAMGVNGDYEAVTIAYSDYFLYTPLPGFVGTDTFTYVIADSTGMMTTGTVSVVVTGDVPPSIPTPPADQAGFVGLSATMSVWAVGSPPLNYQWWFNDTPILNATNAALHLDNLSTNQSGPYFVVITNPFGAITSTLATLTVHTHSVARSDAFGVASGGSLLLPVSALTTNDVPGSANPTGFIMRVTSFSSTGAMGGTLSMINTQLWLARYDGPGQDSDFAKAIAIDHKGNVFVTGAAYVGGTNFDQDFATIAYSHSGVALWTNRYNGSEYEDVATSIATDDAGNIFVTGWSANGAGGATVAYSNAGVPLWTNRYLGQPVAVVADAGGYVFVTGTSPATNGIDVDYATVAYSSAGMALWTNRCDGGNRDDYPTAMAVNKNGTVFVTGQSDSANQDWDYLTVAYSRNGTALWTNRYNGSVNYYDGANAVAADRNGNAIVTGVSHGTLDYSDCLTIAYSGTGVPLWTNRYHGPESEQGEGNANVGRAVAVNRSGDVFVTGLSDGSDSGSEFATIAYSAAGVPLWTNRYSGPQIEGDDSYATAARVANDVNGNVYVTGSSSGTNGPDWVTIAYSPEGTQLWMHRYVGPVYLEDFGGIPLGIAAGAGGKVFLAGSSGQWNPEDYIVIAYSDCLVYTPPPNFTGTDTFTYIAVDNVGMTVTGMVTMTVTSAAPTILIGDGGFGLQSNLFGFNLRAGAGQAIVIEASTNLVQWTPVQTNVANAIGIIMFTDMQSGTYPRRFYRGCLHEGPLPPPSISSAAGLQSGQFGFNLSGIGGQTVVVEASTNLVNWNLLSTNLLGNGPFYFTDPGSTNFPWRFYRVRVQP